MRKLTSADAASCAKQFGTPWMLCEMDYEDERRQYVRALSYADGDEFWAFDGKIIAIGYPDGSIDH